MVEIKGRDMVFALQGEAQISSCAITCRRTDRVEILELPQEMPGQAHFSAMTLDLLCDFVAGGSRALRASAACVMGQTKPPARSGELVRVPAFRLCTDWPGPRPLGFSFGLSVGAEWSEQGRCRGSWRLGPTKLQKVCT